MRQHLVSFRALPGTSREAIPRKAQSTPPREAKHSHAAHEHAPSPAPLRGKRVLVGRAKHQAPALSDAFRSAGADVLEIPFIEIRPPQSWDGLDNALGKILDYDWLILTSVNGVNALFERLAHRGGSEADLLHLNIAAIGPATSAAIEKHGLPVDVVPDSYIAEAVVAALYAQVRGKKVLLVRAKVARDVIPVQLRDAGAHVDVVEAYETVMPEASRSMLRSVLDNPAQRPQVITFTSSSMAKNFADMLGEAMLISGVLNGIKMASIGPVTSQTMKQLGIRVDIEAKEFTVDGLVNAVAAAFK